MSLSLVSDCFPFRRVSLLRYASGNGDVRRFDVREPPGLGEGEVLWRARKGGSFERAGPSVYALSLLGDSNLCTVGGSFDGVYTFDLRTGGGSGVAGTERGKGGGGGGGGSGGGDGSGGMGGGGGGGGCGEGSGGGGALRTLYTFHPPGGANAIGGWASRSLNRGGSEDAHVTSVVHGTHGNSGELLVNYMGTRGCVLYQLDRDGSTG